MTCYYAYELLKKLTLDNYAYCLTHTFEDGDEIEYVEGQGIVWRKSGKLVSLDWILLQSKWEIRSKKKQRKGTFIPAHSFSIPHTSLSYT